MGLCIHQTSTVSLEEVLQPFRLTGVKLKPGKCEGFQREVRYLGRVVSERGASADPDKVTAVRDWARTTNLPEGSFVDYYMRFLKDFATLAKPLNRLISKEEVEFV